MAKPHEPPSHEAFQTQPMDVELLAEWPMMEEKRGWKAGAIRSWTLPLTMRHDIKMRVHSSVTLSP